MTLDIGSPFAVAAKPYVIAAVAEEVPSVASGETVADTQFGEAVPTDMNAASPETQEEPTPKSKPLMLTLVIVVLLVGIGMALLNRRGKGVSQ